MKESGSGGGGGSRLELFVDDLAAVGEEAGFDEFVVRFEDEGFGFFVPVVFEEGTEVGGEHLAGVAGDAAGEVAVADEGDAFSVSNFAGGDAFDVAAAVHGEVHDDAAGAHGIEHGGGDEDGGFAAKDLGGGDDG